MLDIKKIERDAWLYRLRKNRILTWVEELEEVSQYIDILNTSPMTSTLEIESGIVKIEPNRRYISHKFVPHINAGFTFLEISVLLKSKIVEFESEYGKIKLPKKDIYDLKQLVYQYNQQFMSVDMSNKKKLIHLEQSGEVLYYLLGSSINFVSQVNGWCTLTFSNNDNSSKDYCTIFSEEQIKLMEKVNELIKR